MIYRFIGAGMVLLSCGGFGLTIAAQYLKELRLLRQFKTMVEYMEWELSYRLTPLPELCRKTARTLHGPLADTLTALSREMEQQICPDVCSCMYCVLSVGNRLPGSIKRLFGQLGNSLGRFDLDGQLKGFASVRRLCEQEIEKMESGRESRIRSYRTLGFCAGAALIILFV